MSGGVKITEHRLVKQGHQILRKAGKVIWAGEIGEPTEDADYDEIVMCRHDINELGAVLTTKGRHE